MSQIERASKESFDWVSSIINSKNVTSGELELVANELKSWANISSEIMERNEAENEDNPFTKLSGDITKKAKLLSEKWSLIASNHLKKQANKSSKKQIDDDSIKNMVEAGFAESLFLDLSRIDNRIAQFISKKA